MSMQQEGASGACSSRLVHNSLAHVGLEDRVPHGLLDPGLERRLQPERSVVGRQGLVTDALEVAGQWAGRGRAAHQASVQAPPPPSARLQGHRAAVAQREVEVKVRLVD